MVLKSYEQFSATGWEVVLENVKERIEGKIAGNALYINKIQDYYQQTSSKAIVKCIQQIANQYMQKCVHPPHNLQIALTSHTESMSEATRQRKTHYSYIHTLLLPPQRGFSGTMIILHYSQLITTLTLILITMF